MDEMILTLPPEAAGKRLSDYLTSLSVPLPLDCGGRGVCGKCKVRLISGNLGGVRPDKGGYIPSCRAICLSEPAVIGIPVSDGEGLAHFAADVRPGVVQSADEVGSVRAALDIGTTTLAMIGFVREADGGETRLPPVSGLNPQRCFGADVMSRISACDDGHQSDLHRLIIEAVGEMLSELTDRPVLLLTVVGNPTMLHLFCNASPSGMGRYPFTPAFVGTRQLSGGELNLPVERIVLLPSASAFIGSDITAGVMLTRMADDRAPSILMDLGTNGEMVLSVGGRLIAASTAAGPALEGAGISCGVGGIAGAIHRVDFVGQKPVCATIGQKPPVGICGSGLMDLVAGLLRVGIIDEYGYMEDDFSITPDLLLTPRDVREFQLAKSAIRSGMEALTAACGLKIGDLSRVYLAGGLGSYLRPESAAAVGLIPKELVTRVNAIGNSALGGAFACLEDELRLVETERIAGQIVTENLANSSVFQEAFLRNMTFSEDE